MGYDSNNVFQKIIQNQIPAKVVLENDKAMAFYDINPQADIHVIVIPKLECVDFTDFMQKAHGDVAYFFEFIAQVVQHLNLDHYRLVTNAGASAGQSVFHFHMHILSGNCSHSF